MSNKKFIKIVLILSLASMVLLALVNYIVDPFNIFHTNILKQQFQMNERFIKIEYLEKNNKKFNAYLFGSSRIGTTPPKFIEKYVPHSKFYNFTISSANLYDYLLYLRFFIDRGYPLKTLYLQLDIDTMSEYGRVESDYLRKAHPAVENKSLYLYYLDYLSGFFPANIEGKIRKNIYSSEKNNYFIETGIWTRPKKEQQLIENCQEYVNGVKEFHKKNIRQFKYLHEEESMNALLEITRLCKQHHIKLYVFTTPHNQNMMDTFIIEDYLRYLKDISKITDFYDFSGYNTITTNNCNYYEISHYRPFVGALIAGRIFNDNSIKIPNDFGILVTKDNIINHLDYLRKQIKSYELVKINNK